MAITHHYVDPSIAADSGTGTIGDPWGDLEYCLETATPGAAGNQINIKSGTDEILAADLATALAAGTFTASETNPLIFRGYTAAANDLGVGGVSANGGAFWIYNNSTLDYVSFIDLHLHNNNSSAIGIITADDYCTAVRCEINNSIGNGIVFGSSSYISDCYVHDVGASNRYGIQCAGGTVTRNYVDTGRVTDKGLYGIFTTANATISNNIVIASTSYKGIGVAANNNIIENNSVYNSGGTQYGIEVILNAHSHSVKNNLVSGFDGTGGVGIFSNAVSIINYYGGNAVYDCTTNYSVSGIVVEDLGDNETLTASPFVSPSTGDFSPVDTGNIKEGSLPQVIGGGFV